MSSRREVIGGAAALAVGAAVSRTSRARAAANPAAKVIGPIKGGAHGRPFAAYFGDISSVGYVEEEYFIEGVASAFQVVGDLPSDGRFNLSKTGATPYRTRLLVRRPIDPAKFNGTVVVEWINVSAGYDIACADPRGIYDGFAWVSVSAQRVGVHGYEAAFHPPLPAGRGLVQWDPARYGTLSIPGDSLSYDIFTQGARAVGPHRTGKVDPMGGLKVRKLIAIGASQSGFRLVSYINGVQKTENVFDALMPLVFAGRSAPWVDARPNSPLSAPQTKIRDDLSAKVFGLDSETEAPAYSAVRQPDTDGFRYWEIGGASHGGTEQEARIKRITDRDGVSVADDGPPLHISDVLWVPTCDAAILHVHRWINGGPAPPVQPKIEFEGTGATPTIKRDRYGNALGGVRLPDLDAPIAQYLGSTKDSAWLGQTFPFGRDQLKALYPTHQDYVARVKASAERALKDGVIPPYRAAQYVAQAEAAAVPG
ncbi:MAG TPA: alpha/beta hydrolase domain-containing protein [Phenylobacterium sp.]|nr:alpha/beta hydrolase domain-containing protein [Phenylobacterium sp.]